MKPPFDLTKFKACLAAVPRDPRSPTPQPQNHRVTLLPITSDAEQRSRWDDAQDWCRSNVQHQQGHQWSRHMDRKSGRPVFSFSDVNTGVMFALMFR